MLNLWHACQKRHPEPSLAACGPQLVLPSSCWFIKLLFCCCPCQGLPQASVHGLKSGGTAVATGARRGWTRHLPWHPWAVLELAGLEVWTEWSSSPAAPGLPMLHQKFASPGLCGWQLRECPAGRQNSLPQEEGQQDDRVSLDRT